MRVLIVAAALIAAALGTPGSAELTTANVNCRAAAATSAQVLAELSSGQAVKVQSTAGAWSEVEHQPRSCWVLSRYLSTDAAALTPSVYRYRGTTYLPTHRVSRPVGLLSTRNTRVSVPHSSRRTHRASSFRSNGGGGGSCPCNGGNICIGPRGGRYCITSGGNKRYGV